MGRSVPVIDHDGRFVEYVEPAVARRALKAQVVKVATTEPFVLQLPRGMQSVPNLLGRRGVEMMKSLDKFGDLFREEQALWVKTLVPGQVSFEIQIAPGMTVPVKVPSNGDPVCITDRADFASLKRCTDLRTLASPRPGKGGRGLRPPAIRIMTEPEMREYYSQKAVRRGWMKDDGTPDVERAATPVYTEEATAQPAARVELPKSATEELMEQHSTEANLGREGQVALAEVVNPRILHLCQEVSNPDITAAQRMSADAMLDELDSLGRLNNESLQHIMSFGYHKAVKAWALVQLQDRATSEE